MGSISHCLKYTTYFPCYELLWINYFLPEAWDSVICPPPWAPSSMGKGESKELHKHMTLSAHFLHPFANWPINLGVAKCSFTSPAPLAFKCRHVSSHPACHGLFNRIAVSVSLQVGLLWLPEAKAPPGGCNSRHITATASLNGELQWIGL